MFKLLEVTDTLNQHRRKSENMAQKGHTLVSAAVVWIKVTSFYHTGYIPSVVLTCPHKNLLDNLMLDGYVLLTHLELVGLFAYVTHICCRRT